MKHTPTPWEQGMIDPWYVTSKDRTICITTRAPNSVFAKSANAANAWDREAKANAAFIVQAVNSHDELMASLNLMMQAFDPDWPGSCHQDCFDVSDGHGYEMQEAAKDQAKAAIINATKEK